MIAIVCRPMQAIMVDKTTLDKSLHVHEKKFESTHLFLPNKHCLLARRRVIHPSLFFTNFVKKKLAGWVTRLCVCAARLCRTTRFRTTTTGTCFFVATTIPNMSPGFQGSPQRGCNVVTTLRLEGENDGLGTQVC